MKRESRQFIKFCTIILAFCLSAATQVQAQGFGQGRSSFGGGRSGFRSGASGASTRDYNNNSMIGNASISSDPETRRLIVITDEETSQYISQVVTNLDRPKPQVLIKVVFLEVVHTDGSDIGIEGGFNQGINGTTRGNGANVFGLSGLGLTNVPLNRFGQPITGFVPTPPGAGLYQILGRDYEVTLRAIATAGKARVLSRPSILARNNQPATILVGQSVPLITSVRYDTFGNAINGVNYTDVGIILRVTPFITDDGMVEMIVSPEISSLSDTDKVQIQQGAFAPVIDKRSADTVVVTPDNQTVIIGGLIQTKKTENVSKFPLLGDIPGLGALFRRTIKSDAKVELLIFLTPQIVMAPTQLVALSEKETSKAKAPKAFTEKELNDFLDALPGATNSPGTAVPSKNQPTKSGKER